MAPKVCVPMDFGRHLIGSPTHSNLKLNTSEGGEVFASSVILSYNSPVIDHMTTSLHMTSVDMLEFGEAAVRLFVDAAYSGTAEGITRDTFRDINKMASVFEMAWLVKKCAEYFTEIVEAVKTPSYTDLLYLFEEAGFVLEKLKTKDFQNLVIKKIEMLKWKQEFIDNYLENADRLSTKKLDMVIELAGTQVHYVVETLTNQLSEVLNLQESGLSVAHKYLLDNLNLSLCKQSDRELFDKLFIVLENLPDDKMRWTFELYRKSNKRGSDMICAPAITDNPNKRSLSSASTTTCSGVSRCDIVPNLYHDLGLDFDVAFDELLFSISSSKFVTNLLMAFEAIILWYDHKTPDYSLILSVEKRSLLSETLRRLMAKRGWSPLPSKFDRIIKQSMTGYLRGFDMSPFCSPSGDNQTKNFRVIRCIRPWQCLTPLTILSKESRLMFYFNHPSVTSCNSSGKCGFILKTVPSADHSLWNLILCTENEDYDNTLVHFHEEIRAEKMHVYHYQEWQFNDVIFPLSWLGWISKRYIGFDTPLNYEKRFPCEYGWFEVLYDMT